MSAHDHFYHHHTSLTPLSLCPTQHRREKTDSRQHHFSGATSGEGNVLAAGTAVPPDVPVWGEALVEAAAADVRAGDALVVAVVPLADVLGDLDPGGAAEAGVGGDVAVALPGERVVQAEVEELEGVLGAPAGGDVAVVEREVSDGCRGVGGRWSVMGGEGRVWCREG